MEKQPMNKNLIVGASVVLVVAIIVALVMYRRDSFEAVSVASTVPTATTTPSTSTSSSYKDGIYASKGNYISPGGAEDIAVTLTLKNGIVADATVVADAIRPMSKQYQGMFISGFKAQVIGKSIVTLSLDKVSGSSLTPKGFNDAVAKIKAQARI